MEAPKTPPRHYSTQQAAEILGVTRHQIAMLVRNEEIYATMVSGVLLVDPYSLQQYKQLQCGRGRPISSDVAWGMLWMLSGLDTPWLTYQQHRRAVLKLREISAKELAWQTRKRSTLQLYRAPTHLFNEISSYLTLSGKSTYRPDAFGIQKNNYELEGYADEETLDYLIEKYELSKGTGNNLIIHHAATTPWTKPGDIRRMPHMPVAAVACDLAGSLNQNEASAGIRSLEVLLSAFRRASI